MRIATLAVAIVLFASVAAAEDTATVKVGDGTLNGAFLQPYNNAWFYTVKTGDGVVHPQGIWTDHLQWTTIDGRKALMRVQGTIFIAGKSNVVINTFDLKTLAPIGREAHNIDGSISRRSFAGAHITEAFRAAGATSDTTTSADLPEPVYDFNGGLYGILLAALPLRKGLVGSLPAVNDDGNALSAEPFRVLRQETISAGARGRVKAWVVQSVKPGNYTMTFWLTKKPPYIIHLVMDDHANKRLLTWDMI